MRGNGVVVFDEVCSGDDEGITEAAVLSGIFHFFGEYVAAVDDAGDVSDENVSCCLGFTNFVFAEVDMFDAFVGKCG